MAMFDNPKRELAKLEKELLKEERWLDQELEMAKALIGDELPRREQAQRPMDETQIYRTTGTMNIYASNPVPSQSVRNFEDYDVDLDDYGDEVYEPKQKGVKGLVFLACLETLGIVAVVAYWLLYLL